jgi:hypothetical protein
MIATNRAAYCRRCWAAPEPVLTSAPTSPAVADRNQRAKATETGQPAWMFGSYQLLNDGFRPAADHSAGGWLGR